MLLFARSDLTATRSVQTKQEGGPQKLPFVLYKTRKKGTKKGGKSSAESTHEKKRGKDSPWSCDGLGPLLSNSLLARLLAAKQDDQTHTIKASPGNLCQRRVSFCDGVLGI